MAINGPIYSTFGGSDFVYDPNWIGGVLANIAEPMQAMPVLSRLPPIRISLGGQLLGPVMAEFKIYQREAQLTVFRESEETFSFRLQDSKGGVVDLDAETFALQTRADVAASLMAGGLGTLIGGAALVLIGATTPLAIFIGLGYASLAGKTLYNGLARNALRDLIDDTFQPIDHTISYEIAGGVRSTSSFLTEGWNSFDGPREAAADLLNYRFSKFAPRWQESSFRDTIAIYEGGEDSDALLHRFAVYGPEVVGAIQTALYPGTNFIFDPDSPVVRGGSTYFILGPDRQGNASGGMIRVEGPGIPESHSLFDPARVVLSPAVLDGQTVAGSTRADLVIGMYQAPLGETFDARGGRDLVFGMGGADTFLGATGARLDGDVFYGGDLRIDAGNADANDTVSYSQLGAGILLSLQSAPRDPTLRDLGLGMAAVSRSGGRLDRLYEIENLIGTGFADRIEGDDGDNRIVAAAGADRIIGSRGADMIFGGSHTDTVDYTDLRADGIDVTPLDAEGRIWRVTIDRDVQFLSSVERIVGTPGRASFSRAGGDLIDGTEEDDSRSPYSHESGSISGPYTYRARGGSDILYGSTGNDLFDGGTGNDIMDGGDGDDVFLYRRGDGDDTIQAGQPHDNFFADRIRFGPGIDAADLTFSRNGSLNPSDVVINIQGDGQITLPNQISASKIDYLVFDDGLVIDMESVLVPVTGTDQNDLLQGADPSNIRAREGALLSDVIFGLDGDDSINTGDGLDRVEGGRGDDTIFGGGHDDHLNGGTGGDTIVGETGDDRIIGGGGNDDLRGESGDDVLEGNGGNDIFNGGGGDDLVVGDAGDDQLHGSFGDDLLEGGLGVDYLGGDAGNDSLLGGADVDILDGGTGTDVLMGEAGDDELHGAAGDDVLDGGTGEDLLLGGLGIDRFIFTWSSGRDVIQGFDPVNDILVVPQRARIVELQFDEDHRVTVGQSVVILEDTTLGFFDQINYEYI